MLDWHYEFSTMNLSQKSDLQGFAKTAVNISLHCDFPEMCFVPSFHSNKLHKINCPVVFKWRDKFDVMCKKLQEERKKIFLLVFAIFCIVHQHCAHGPSDLESMFA